MRKSGWMVAALAGGALLAGCRNTACEDLATAYAGVEQKSRPCLDHAPLPAFDPARCEQNLRECGGDDLDTIEAQVKCYQKLDTCQPEQKAAFLQGVSDCDNNALSNTCEAAIF